ncbi:putative germin-like protein 2-1 [Quercus suber]|uniref:Germin-like protein 2-1 n=1 Tax=Quercus suber TaxID=58331 RepID=A0AAW0JRI9_QUESU
MALLAWTRQADHFFLSGLDKAGNTSNPLGSSVTPVTVAQIPGLNTLGIALARLDYAPWGLIPLHFHPRATSTFISKVLQKGDVFVFPVGLIHFQQNSSQNPGIITVANAVLGSKPSIADDILSKAFQVDKSVIDYL